MEEPETQITIGEYLIRLAEEPDLVEAFRRNPERAMRNAGVSTEQRDLVLQGNLKEIRKSVQEFAGGAQVAFMVWPRRPPKPPMVW